jgi:cyanophycin synthetase
MKIIKVQALRGPNIWVSRKKINQMRLDLEEMEQFQPIK